MWYNGENEIQNGILVDKIMREFLKNELYGWKKGEVAWLMLTCLVITGLSIYWQDSLMGIISAVSGIAYVIFAGKGKLSAYIFGLVNCVLYAIISYEAKLYGETMLNALYYFPMQFVGFFVWKKNMDADTHTVKKRHMQNRGRILVVLVIAAATYVYGLLLEKLGDQMPYLDSFTTVSSVVALIISIGMFSEQWWIWLFVNGASVYMWWRDFSAGSDNLATLLMWVVYLISGIIMLVQWEKEIMHKNE